MNKKYALLLAIFGGIIIAGALGYLYKSNADQKTILIPREVLFENPQYTYVQISPDGKWLSYLATQNGQLNLWIKDLETKKIKAITHHKDRPISSYSWSYDNQHILYLKDCNGDENLQLYKVDINTGISTLLSPEKGVQARIMGESPLHPNKVLIGLNNRDPIYHDVYVLDIATGKKTMLLENKEFLWFIFDDDYNVVFGSKQNDKGDVHYYQPTLKNKWSLYRKVALADSIDTGPLGLDLSREWMYWLDSEGTDKVNLIKMHIKTKKKQILFQGQSANINNVCLHPTTKEILSLEENYLRRKFIPAVKDVKEDFDVLQKIDAGEVSIVSSTIEQTKWVVCFWDSHQSNRYYLYDRTTKKADFLFYSKSKWIGLPFVKMQPVEIKSRDGLTLVSYLSLPKNKKDGVPVPMVLIVHGGPFGVRDDWGMDPSHQWLANRGYAVLSVNYRGSGGFGKSFGNAGYGEYGRKMHNDLIDAVNWAITERIADPKKIAIYGGSYGGYAALVGATMTPDVFACSIAYVGISNLVTFLDTIPPYWKVAKEWFKSALGADPTTKKGRDFLLSRSPITHVDNIKKPLLIAHGLNDARVKKSESDQIVAKMKQKGIPITYIMFPDEGHGFVRPVNRLANIAVNEAFLHKHLGGDLEPLSDEIDQSSMQILEGKVEIQ